MTPSRADRWTDIYVYGKGLASIADLLAMMTKPKVARHELFDYFCSAVRSAVLQ